MRPRRFPLDPKAPPRPIYSIAMHEGCWRLLWWMICEMDAEGVVKFGWRAKAARDLRRHRKFVTICERILYAERLIDRKKGAGARVMVENFVGGQ